LLIMQAFKRLAEIEREPGRKPRPQGPVQAQALAQGQALEQLQTGPVAQMPKLSIRRHGFDDRIRDVHQVRWIKNLPTHAGRQPPNIMELAVNAELDEIAFNVFHSSPQPNNQATPSSSFCN